MTCDIKSGEWTGPHCAQPPHVLSVMFLNLNVQWFGTWLHVALHSASEAPAVAMAHPCAQEGCWSQPLSPTEQWPAASHFCWQLSGLGEGAGGACEQESCLGRNSVPFPPGLGPQTALKCSYRSDGVTRA